MRISTVTDEWLRNPLLVCLPVFALLLAGLADAAAHQDMFALASSFALLSHSGIFVLVALLAVGFVRL